jgi:transposase
MKKKKIITNYTVEEIEELLHSKEEYRVAMRLMACLFVAKEFSIADLQNIFYYKSAARYFFWARRFNKEGIDGLIERGGRGRKSKLSDKEFEELRDILINKSPREFGFDSKNWNGQIITDLIMKRYGIEYQKANIYIMLKTKLGIVNKKKEGIFETI